MSDFLDKAKDLAAEHGDQAVEAVDTVTDVVDEKTGGRASGLLDGVDTAVSKANEALGG